MASLPADRRSAISTSIEASDLFKSGSTEIPGGGTPTDSCPAFKSIIDFVPPPRQGPLRVRRAAHLVDAEYLEKYKKAVELMRALPAEDPHSFMQQANVYRAYCDGAFEQIGFPKPELQVRNTWFFVPWHRFYLYFYERILGKLIDDDSFAIPFWNWDVADGRAMPFFYSKNRNPNHQPPTLIVSYDGNTNPHFNESELIEDNLTIMHRQMILNGKTPELFFGSPYRAGDEPSPGSGSIEQISQGPIHDWIENFPNSNNEDMDNFYSSGRYDYFYGFYGNIDRLWSVWEKLGGMRGNFNDDGWLAACFYFYDESRQLVRAKVSDCLDTEKLGYTYEQVEIPWVNKRPTPMAATNRLLKKKAPEVTEEPVFPITLNKPVSVTVKRPKRGRPKKEKEDEEEVLLVEDIEVGRYESAKFDVYINLSEEDGVRPSASEFAGSFVNLPRGHMHGHGQNVNDLKTHLRLGITDLLEDIGADDDDTVVVTLLPRAGNGHNMKVGRLRIEFFS